jgi:hypothetical protein
MYCGSARNCEPFTSLFVADKPKLGVRKPDKKDVRVRDMDALPLDDMSLAGFSFAVHNS